MSDTLSPENFHLLYGKKVNRMVYRSEDFIDYAIMNVMVVAVAMFVFGVRHPMTYIVIALCLWMVLVFGKRHGLSLRMPLWLTRPQDVIYMCAYKLRNMRAAYFAGAALIAAENVAIWLTPDLPHHTEFMRKLAFGLFYAHLGIFTAYRTAILISHLRRREHVRSFLMETSWRAMLKRQPSITIELFHAYFTGVLAHIMLVAPWYVAISYFQYSVLFLPLTIPLGIYIHSRFLKVVNLWFYRDHWTSHHSELEFVYLHGQHHDAIPSGLIGVSENGVLEGVLRHTIGSPGIFYNPVVDFLVHGIDLKIGIDGHQYIPGVYPRISKGIQMINQHSLHHFGMIKPYGPAVKFDQPGVPEDVLAWSRRLTEDQRNSVQLDEKLNGYEWNNPRHQKYLELYEKYLNR